MLGYVEIIQAGRFFHLYCEKTRSTKLYIRDFEDLIKEIDFSILDSSRHRKQKMLNVRKHRSVRRRIGGQRRVQNNGHSREIVLSPDPSTFSPFCPDAVGGAFVSI